MQFISNDFNQMIVLFFFRRQVWHFNVILNDIQILYYCINDMHLFGMC